MNKSINFYYEGNYSLDTILKNYYRNNKEIISEQ